MHSVGDLSNKCILPRSRPLHTITEPSADTPKTRLSLPPGRDPIDVKLTASDREILVKLTKTNAVELKSRNAITKISLFITRPI